MLEKAQYAEQLKDQEKDGNILIWESWCRGVSWRPISPQSWVPAFRQESLCIRKRDRCDHRFLPYVPSGKSWGSLHSPRDCSASLAYGHWKEGLMTNTGWWNSSNIREVSIWREWLFCISKRYLVFQSNERIPKLYGIF
jgi:hypothetical protein